MKFEIITLFPQMFEVLTHWGVTGRAHEKKIWALRCWNPRDYADNSYCSVDDHPFGGGSGMVMMVPPLEEAIKMAQRTQMAETGTVAPVFALTPQGVPLTQKWLRQLVHNDSAIVVCGRYEGIDQRLIDRAVSLEISLGDFILSGGEVAALALLDAWVRLLPGALGNCASIEEESFVEGLLEYPQYAKPRVHEGEVVPDVLLSGHHAHIKKWQRQQALGRTWLRRPDGLPELGAEDKKLLDEFCKMWPGNEESKNESVTAIE